MGEWFRLGINPFINVRETENVHDAMVEEIFGVRIVGVKERFDRRTQL